MSEYRSEFLGALKNAGLDTFAFYHNENPLCPHCGETVMVDSCDYGDLYVEDGDKNIVECHSCYREFYVTTSLKITFFTDDQSGLREGRNDR